MSWQLIANWQQWYRLASVQITAIQAGAAIVFVGLPSEWKTVAFVNAYAAFVAITSGLAGYARVVLQPNLQLQPPAQPPQP